MPSYSYWLSLRTLRSISSGSGFPATSQMIWRIHTRKSNLLQLKQFQIIRLSRGPLRLSFPKSDAAILQQNKIRSDHSMKLFLCDFSHFKLSVLDRNPWKPHFAKFAILTWHSFVPAIYLLLGRSKVGIISLPAKKTFIFFPTIFPHFSRGKSRYLCTTFQH